MSRIDELREYKDLLDSGVITREEYDAKKQVLLTKPESVKNDTVHNSYSQTSYVHNAVNMPHSTGKVGNKSKIVAGILGLALSFLLPFGIYNFYLGKIERGVLQIILWIIGLVLCLVFVGFIIIFAIQIWQFVEGILILTSKKGSPWHLDGYGNELQD